MKAVLKKNRCSQKKRKHYIFEIIRVSFYCHVRFQEAHSKQFKNWKSHHLTDGNSQSSEACGFLIEVRHIISSSILRQLFQRGLCSDHLPICFTCSGSEREAGTNFGGVQERRGGIAGCLFLLRKWMDLDLWKIKQRNHRSWSHFWLKKAVQWTTKKMEFQLQLYRVSIVRNQFEVKHLKSHWWLPEFAVCW